MGTARAGAALREETSALPLQPCSEARAFLRAAGCAVQVLDTGTNPGSPELPLPQLHTEPPTVFPYSPQEEMWSL